jgi:hypothetical protein
VSFRSIHPVKSSNLGVRGPGNLVKNYGAAAVRRVWLATMIPRTDKNIFITATMFYEGQNDPPQLYKTFAGPHERCGSDTYTDTMSVNETGQCVEVIEILLHPCLLCEAGLLDCTGNTPGPPDRFFQIVSGSVSPEKGICSDPRQVHSMIFTLPIFHRIFSENPHLNRHDQLRQAHPLL